MSADVGDLIQSEETADHSNQEELIQIEKTEIELHFCSIRTVQGLFRSFLFY